MKNLRNSLIDGCIEIDDKQKVNIDIGYIIENLLLFNKFIIDSIRLKEIPALVQIFGIEGLNQLFNMGALKIHARSLSVGQEKGALPKGSYSFSVYKILNHVNSFMSTIDNINFLNKNERNKLKSMIYKNIMLYPDDASTEIINQLENDLRNADFSIKIALSKIIEEEKGIKVNPNSYDINIIEINKGIFKVESDIQDLILPDINEYHKIAERALLTIGRRNQRIYNMKYFNAITSFRENDVPLFYSKLNFLADKLNANKDQETLKRVLEIKDFPRIDSNLNRKNFNVEKFLKILDSKECKEFRSWLWSINEFNESEIEDNINDFKQQIGEFVRSPLGKTLRWVTGIGLGIVPNIGLALSGTYGLLDCFLLDKVLPVDGALIFLNKKLPTGSTP